MATKKLTVQRDMTVEDADQVLASIAKTTAAIRRVEVIREQRVQSIIDECEEKTAEMRQELARLETQLGEFIMGHQGEFTRPRMRVTSFGSYGLRSSTVTEYADKAKCVAWLKANGYAPAVKVKESPISKAVTQLLRAGEPVEGAALVAQVTHKYELDPTILEEL